MKHCDILKWCNVFNINCMCGYLQSSIWILRQTIDMWIEFYHQLNIDTFKLEKQFQLNSDGKCDGIIGNKDAWPRKSSNWAIQFQWNTRKSMPWWWTFQAIGLVQTHTSKQLWTVLFVQGTNKKRSTVSIFVFLFHMIHLSA